jgi:hypothetical protein
MPGRGDASPVFESPAGSSRKPRRRGGMCCAAPVSSGTERRQPTSPAPARPEPAPSQITHAVLPNTPTQASTPGKPDPETEELEPEPEEEPLPELEREPEPAVVSKSPPAPITPWEPLPGEEETIPSGADAQIQLAAQVAAEAVAYSGELFAALTQNGSMAGRVEEADKQVEIAAQVAAEAVALSAQLAAALEHEHQIRMERRQYFVAPRPVRPPMPKLEGKLDADTRSRLYREVGEDFFRIEGLMQEAEDHVADTQIAAREQAQAQSKNLAAQEQLTARSKEASQKLVLQIDAERSAVSSHHIQLIF